jgi:hypothetical protein
MPDTKYRYQNSNGTWVAAIYRPVKKNGQEILYNDQLEPFVKSKNNGSPRWTSRGIYKKYGNNKKNISCFGPFAIIRPGFIFSDTQLMDFAVMPESHIRALSEHFHHDNKGPNNSIQGRWDTIVTPPEFPNQYQELVSHHQHSDQSSEQKNVSTSPTDSVQSPITNHSQVTSLENLQSFNNSVSSSNNSEPATRTEELPPLVSNTMPPRGEPRFFNTSRTARVVKQKSADSNAHNDEKPAKKAKNYTDNSNSMFIAAQALLGIKQSDDSSAVADQNMTEISELTKHTSRQ